MLIDMHTHIIPKEFPPAGNRKSAAAWPSMDHFETGRAKVMGQTSLGNVETEWAYSFKDGSRVWLAHELFQPPGLPLAIWEGRGIIPDLPLPVRWDLFTEANDPALAAAVELFK